MKKSVMSLISILFLILFTTTIVQVKATEPLPPPPQNEFESTKLIADAKTKIDKTEQLFIQSKNMISNENGISNKLFIKKIIRKMSKELFWANKELAKAEQANLTKNYDVVNGLHVSIINKTSYIDYNLKKILAGKTKKDRTKVDIEISN